MGMEGLQKSRCAPVGECVCVRTSFAMCAHIYVCLDIQRSAGGIQVGNKSLFHRVKQDEHSRMTQTQTDGVQVSTVRSAETCICCIMWYLSGKFKKFVEKQEDF